MEGVNMYKVFATNLVRVWTNLDILPAGTEEPGLEESLLPWVNLRLGVALHYLPIIILKNKISM